MKRYIVAGSIGAVAGINRSALNAYAKYTLMSDTDMMIPIIQSQAADSRWLETFCPSKDPPLRP